MKGKKSKKIKIKLDLNDAITLHDCLAMVWFPRTHEHADEADLEFIDRLDERLLPFINSNPEFRRPVHPRSKHL